MFKHCIGICFVMGLYYILLNLLFPLSLIIFACLGIAGLCDLWYEIKVTKELSFDNLVISAIGINTFIVWLPFIYVLCGGR
jgi:hypothetical protein